jgi:biopolymer transport protein ExbD
MFQRPKRRVPSLNATATADISFMLLIFFLVTSSMDTDKGLPRQLPPPQDEQTEVEFKVKERNVLTIELDANDLLTCNGEPISQEALLERIKHFVANPENDAELPEKSTRELNFFGRCEVSDRHILSIQTYRNTSYDAYFQLQNTIARAYAQLRNEMARKHFGKALVNCSLEEREAIGMIYPQRISEQPVKVAEEGSAAGAQQQKGGSR